VGVPIGSAAGAVKLAVNKFGALVNQMELPMATILVKLV